MLLMEFSFIQDLFFWENSLDFHTENNEKKDGTQEKNG
jgi:hypothetical protein